MQLAALSLPAGDPCRTQQLYIRGCIASSQTNMQFADRQNRRLSQKSRAKIVTNDRKDTPLFPSCTQPLRVPIGARVVEIGKLTLEPPVTKQRSHSALFAILLN